MFFFKAGFSFTIKTSKTDFRPYGRGSASIRDCCSGSGFARRLSIILSAVIILSAAGSCTGKKDGSRAAINDDEVFAYEKRVLLDIIDALERYKGKITNAETPEAMTAANWELAEKFERLMPQIAGVTEKHPEWGEHPPLEMAPYIQKYLSANREFSTMTMLIVENFVEEHPEDSELALSFQAIKELTKKKEKEAVKE
ncbi:MAG: hypothetical protein JW881_06580 [Spirochaetales bacterium]|nr:hypothetical protein [Spirochaetales bacterium]